MRCLKVSVSGMDIFFMYLHIEILYILHVNLYCKYFELCYIFICADTGRQKIAMTHM